MKYAQLAILASAAVSPMVASAQILDLSWSQPTGDRWNYPFNSTPGTETRAPVFAALLVSGFDDRDSQVLLQFDTQGQVPVSRPLGDYKLTSITFRATVASTTPAVYYDPTPDPLAASYDVSDSQYVADPDLGTPLEIYGVGFRNGRSLATFNELQSFGCGGFPVEGCRSVYPVDFDSSGTVFDISRQVRQKLPSSAWAIGLTNSLNAGDVVPVNTVFTFSIDLSRPDVRNYFKSQLAAGRILVAMTSLHPASGGAGGGGGDYPAFYTKDGSTTRAPKLDLHLRVYSGADFNADGVVDFFDYLDFVDAFSSNAPDADFNEDSVIDFFDYLDFVNAFTQ